LTQTFVESMGQTAICSIEGVRALLKLSQQLAVPGGKAEAEKANNFICRFSHSLQYFTHCKRVTGCDVRHPCIPLQLAKVCREGMQLNSRKTSKVQSLPAEMFCIFYTCCILKAIRQEPTAYAVWGVHLILTGV